jgi:hypothetical protein
MHKLDMVLFAVCGAIVLSGACAARITHQEPTGDAEEPGLSRGNNEPKPIPTPYEVARAWLKEHPGKCGVACFDAWAGTCGDYSLCREQDAEPDDLIACGSSTYLTCEAAREATAVRASGLDACAHICDQLQSR